MNAGSKHKPDTFYGRTLHLKTFASIWRKNHDQHLTLHFTCQLHAVLVPYPNMFLSYVQYEYRENMVCRQMPCKKTRPGVAICVQVQQTEAPTKQRVVESTDAWWEVCSSWTWIPASKITWYQNGTRQLRPGVYSQQVTRIFSAWKRLLRLLTLGFGLVLLARCPCQISHTIYLIHFSTSGFASTPCLHLPKKQRAWDKAQHARPGVLSSSTLGQAIASLQRSFPSLFIHQ